MSYPSPSTTLAQFPGLFHSLVLDRGLLLEHLACIESLTQTVGHHCGKTVDRIYSPVINLASSLTKP
jgi:hypothetical protein